MELGDSFAGYHARRGCSNLSRTSGAKCVRYLETTAAFEHGYDVFVRNSLQHPKPSGCDVDGSLRVIERIGLIRATGSQLFRHLRGIPAVSEPLKDPSPIALRCTVL